MILTAKANQFHFKFPRGFFPPEIVEKYEKYLKATPTSFKKLEDYINHTIQAVSFPEISLDNPVQTNASRFPHKSRNGFEAIRLIDKRFTVDLKHTEGYLSYYVFFESLLEFGSHKELVKWLPDLSLVTTSFDNLSVVNIKMSEVLYSGLSTLSLNYTNVKNEFNTFQVSFDYNNLDINFDFLNGK